MNSMLMYKNFAITLGFTHLQEVCKTGLKGKAKYIALLMITGTLFAGVGL